MNFNNLLPILLMVLSLVLALLVTVRSWHQREKPAVKWFLFLMAAIIWWLPCSIMENTVTQVPYILFWMKLSFVAVVALPVLWLVFTLEYTDTGKWLRSRGLPLLFVIPVVTTVMIWTNDTFHLMWVSINVDTSVFPAAKFIVNNIWYWVHSIYCYFLLLAGTLCLFRLFFQTSGIYRKQVGIMLLATFAPWIANYLFISRIVSSLSIDPTPIAFVITGIAFYWGLSRVQLLNTRPIAYETVLHNMSDGVIIVDKLDCITEINRSAARVLEDDACNLVGKKVDEFLPEYAFSSTSGQETDEKRTILCLGQEERQRFYEISVSPIVAGQPNKGLVILLHDDTERRKAESESREKLLLEKELRERRKVEDALRESEQFNLSLMENSPAPLCVNHPDMTIKYVNPALEKMSGYSREELIGRKAPYPWWTEDKVHEYLQNNRNGLAPGDAFREERVYRNKNGEPFRAEIHSTNIMETGKIKYRITSWVDLTERKKMERTLIESSERLQALTEESPVIVCNIDPNGTISYVNRKFEEVTGYRREETIGKNSFKLGMFPPETVPYLESRVQAIAEGSPSNPAEIRFRCRDGHIIWISIVARPIREDNKTTGLQVIAQDITERKQSEEKLRKSEEKYRMVFESANDAFLLLDSKGTIIDVNRRITDIGGFDRNDLIGNNFKELTKIMPKKSIMLVAKNFGKRLLGLNVPAYEVEMYSKKGDKLHIEINAVPVRDGDKTIGTLATLRDITERKHSESALAAQRELIDQIIVTIPNSVLVADGKTNVLMANDAFYRHFEMSRNHVEGRALPEIIDVKELQKALSTIMIVPRKSISLEFNYELNDTRRAFKADVVKMQGNRYLILLNDVTDEREKQERLYLTDRLASVGEMAAGVAHELNNPLTSIIGLSQLLAEQDDIPGEVHEDLDAIKSEALRCAAIVKNLLSFARKHSTSREPVQVTSILEDVLKLRAYEQRAHNITVETSFPESLPEVHADYFQIQQVFLNLILNAEAAMVDAHGQGTLHISAETANSHINILFSDDGPGIEKGNIRQIFDPFFTTKEVGKGTGLGLSICYGIVASHNGKIHARSKYGKGTTFTVELPVTSN